MNPNTLGNLTSLIGRLLIVVIFFISAWGKIVGFEKSVAYVADNGLPYPAFFLVAAIVFELLGGLSVGLGLKPRFGALVLIAFLIPATFLFHDFWNDGDLKRRVETIMFLKNLSIMGGLAILAAQGGGDWTLDRWLAHWRYRCATRQRD